MARQSTLNVSLTPKLDEYVRAKVKTGRYESASEVIRESLRALQERERAAEAYWASVRGKVAVARDQVAHGQTHDGETAMNEILAEIEPDALSPRKRARKSR